jgi:hypothetical protein
MAGFRSERVAGIKLECMAGFVGIRTLSYNADARAVAESDDRASPNRSLVPGFNFRRGQKTVRTDRSDQPGEIGRRAGEAIDLPRHVRCSLSMKEQRKLPRRSRVELPLLPRAQMGLLRRVFNEIYDTGAYPQSS